MTLKYIVQKRWSCQEAYEKHVFFFFVWSRLLWFHNACPISLRNGDQNPSLGSDFLWVLSKSCWSKLGPNQKTQFLKVKIQSAKSLFCKEKRYTNAPNQVNQCTKLKKRNCTLWEVCSSVAMQLYTSHSYIGDPKLYNLGTSPQALHLFDFPSSQSSTLQHHT